ncbi:YobI family P-loop NTPase [Acinetobacter sp. 161(2023)]|uniref:YobI family P-loop NTPase n=1 Tax=Acinetobacter sp. 161(2023) TaxID=3098768 RepID=UPI00300A49C3
MSKDKLQKIWNEIKITYAKIKEIYLAPQITSSHQYLSLTPITNADEDNAYSDMLKFALSQKKTNNIAITGPYGSGKSSVLQTFQKNNPQWKYLNISLATFKDHLEIEGNNKEIEIEAIEKSILQQLFYSVDQKTLPRSRLKRIVTVQPRELIANTLFIFLWAFLTLFIFFPESIFFDKFSILASSDQLAQTTVSLLFLMYCIVGLFTGIKYIEKLKELKLKFQDTEITLNNDTVESILNKHLDEILYFFERTDFGVIVIEDLDRFESSEIFIRLRELNTLVNNSKQVNRPIVFLYAIRDNMFQDKDRSKFFDFIVPIIPVINPANAYELIRKNYINEENDRQLHNEIEDIFLHQVSLYFDDMRLVTNIFNEFKLYVQKLKNPNLNKNKLLALIIYKNYYPAEFANLHSNKGEIYEIFKISKKNIIASQLEQIKQEIITLDEKIQASQLEKIQTVTELRKLYVYEILKRYPNITGASNNYNYIRSTSYLVKLKIGDSYLDHNNLTTDENFNILQNSDNIEWFVEITSNNTNIEIQNSQDITFTFKKIENRVNATLSYTDRETSIINRETTNRGKLLEQKQGLVNKKNSLQLNTLKELLSKDISEEFFYSENHPPLLQFLIREGYIDEHYPDYISLFIDSVINISERDYAQRVINHINSDFDINLTNVKKILEKYLTPRQFSHTSILNFSLVDFILENHDKFNDHYNNLFKLLSNQDERSIKFIFEYIDRGKNSSLFINEIVKIWQAFFEYIHTSMTDEKVESYLLLILKNLEKESISFLNKDDILKNYLSSKINFIEYIKDTHSTEQETISFLEILEPKFDYLECKNEEDRSLFNEICQKEYFEFNEKMILQIILLNNEDKNHNEIINKFKSMPYSISMNFAPMYLKSQIENKINQYFEKILYTSTHKLNEYEHYFIDLINKLNLDDSHKIWLIENNEVQIDLISYIREAKFWKPILSENKVKPSWDSLISYYKHNDSTLDEVISKYIDKNNELLKEQKISDSESKKSTPEITNEFEIALLESDSFSETSYQAIVYARMFNYKSLDLSNLSNSKISLLISEKVLSLTSENTESLRKKSSSYIRDIIVRNSGDFLELIEEIILENHEYELLLQSSELTYAQKLIIVEKLGINFYQESNVQHTINQIFKYNGKYIPIEYINNYFSKILSTQTRVKFLIPEIPNLDHPEISRLLNMLDEPYKLITDIGNHSLSYSNENESLINALKEIGYVNRVIVREKKSLLGVKSKSTITFTTKS